MSKEVLIDRLRHGVELSQDERDEIAKDLEELQRLKRQVLDALLTKMGVKPQ